ncbi:O-methyltransferase [Rhizobium albus]|nr:O-methyltransferase [Rhizobium albus]
MMGLERTQSAEHAVLMDSVYRYQRHIYDLTRKYFLLGRDQMLDALAVPTGGIVLELGCGTGRNLLAAAKRYPDARYYGIDVSPQMLETARGNIDRAAHARKIIVAEGDATNFDCQALFGFDKADRVFISYAVSMIPSWQQAIAAALKATKPGGSVHIVDFGQQVELPPAFRRLLTAWLERFHVTPRADLFEVAKLVAASDGAQVENRSLFRDYARIVVITRTKGR